MRGGVSDSQWGAIQETGVRGTLSFLTRKKVRGIKNIRGVYLFPGALARGPAVVVFFLRCQIEILEATAWIHIFESWRGS